MGRILQEIRATLFANRMILNYPNLKTEKNRVNLHWYRAQEVHQDANMVNLGDYLSEVVVEKMLERKGLSLASKAKTAHLYAIGSILLMGYQKATVWGSGLPFEPTSLRGRMHRFSKLDLRCVRGPLTRQTLRSFGAKCPEVYGDPAVLMPLFFDPRQETSLQSEFVFIPHYQKEERPSCIAPQAQLSMNTEDYQTVIRRICGAWKVISASLHGIILAEAYGVPAIFYQNRPQRFNYKYEDWYASTNRPMKVYTDIEEALQAPTPDVPDLSEMQQALCEAFPYDLWDEET